VFGGYRVLELSPGIFRIQFRRQATDFNAQRASDLALLRAAELTLEQGHCCFVVDRGSRGRVSWTRLWGAGFRESVYVIQVLERLALDAEAAYFVYNAADVRRKIRSTLELGAE
jgi:hypothetical protein